MQATVPILLMFAATALNGILVGASLDQSIKQLPARKRMGAIAFSLYSRSADLSNGIVWYATLGIGTALITIAATIATFVAGNAYPLPILLAAILSVLHSLATSRAAPTNFKQLKVPNDEVALTAIFDTFDRWQSVRVVLQVLTLLAVLWALFVAG
ncbi:hypothetical protein [Dictyobacter formicarum]|uniref:DUF1772 domain-containing protein n=1 Tax=Dictyobacter formicarum TaxID=2778368 RepID=A0ABQ3VRS3_9CHLR|nr:hypothetical protein [Dictyobacter formicarum]GHO88528.1 hypothetical protein KSZ_65340 [Dictyobacter formicarum]